MPEPGFFLRGGGADFDDVEALEGWQIIPKGRRILPGGTDFVVYGPKIYQNNRVKKGRTLRTGGDAGQVRCSSGGMQNRSDAGQV